MVSWSMGEHHDGTIWAIFSLVPIPANGFSNIFEIPFFNYFLKGKGDYQQIAEANIFITGANEWKTFSQWPPAEKAR